MTTQAGARTGHSQLRSGTTGWAVAVVILGLSRVLPAAAQTNGTIGDTLQANSLKSTGPGGPQADLHVGAYETDNARRTSSNTITDTVIATGLTLGAAHNGARLEYAATGDINYLKYAKDTYRGEVFGYLDANARYAFVPERFDWIVRDSFDKLLLDPTASVTPSNVETYNYLTTGPRFRLHFGSATELMIQALYSVLTSINSANTTGIATNLDSKRYGANSSLIHSLSEASQLSLNLNEQRVRYDDRTLDADYDRGEISLGYNTKIARTLFAAELGDSRIAQQGHSSNGILTRLGVTRKVSPSSRAELSFTRQTADAADLIRYDFGGVRPDQSPLRVASHDPLVDTTLTLGWRFETARTDFSADVYRTQERYTVSHTLDRDVTGTHVDFERRLQPRLGMQVSARYERQSFANSGGSDNEYDVSAALNWYLGFRLQVSFLLNHFDRRSQNGNTFSYTENRVGVRAAYNLLKRRQAP
jgi:hypothetical protein